MLVLGRKIGEDIRIGHDIRVRILGVDPHGNVRLGIDAPAHVSVHREEIYQRIRAKEETP